MNPTATDVDDALSPIPLLNSVTLNDLKSELPSYLSCTADLDLKFVPFTGGNLMPQLFLSGLLLLL